MRGGARVAGPVYRRPALSCRRGQPNSAGSGRACAAASSSSGISKHPSTARLAPPTRPSGSPARRVRAASAANAASAPGCTATTARAADSLNK